MYSNKETLEMVAFIARLVSASDAALADGKVNLLDGYLLLDPIKVSAAAIQGADQIPNEVGDLTEEEFAQIQEVIAKELQLRSEFAEELTLDITEVVGKIAIILRKVKEHRAAQTPKEEV